MSAAIGRMLTGLTRASLGGGTLIHKATVRLSVRSLALSCQTLARLKPTDDEANKPIKFSTSKASHRTWKVDRSMGSQFQQPYWKVFSISLFFVTILLWCALRGTTDIDEHMDTQLYDHLPALLPDEEEAQTQNKSD